MSPFEIYLRTGRIVSAPEAKFNPWHDIEDGRFTFRNSGRHWGGKRAQTIVKKAVNQEAANGMAGAQTGAGKMAGLVASVVEDKALMGPVLAAVGISRSLSPSHRADHNRSNSGFLTLPPMQRKHKARPTAGRLRRSGKTVMSTNWMIVTDRATLTANCRIRRVDGLAARNCKPAVWIGVPPMTAAITLLGASMARKMRSITLRRIGTSIAEHIGKWRALGGGKSGRAAKFTLGLFLSIAAIPSARPQSESLPISAARSKSQNFSTSWPEREMDDKLDRLGQLYSELGTALLDWFGPGEHHVTVYVEAADMFVGTSIYRDEGHRIAYTNDLSVAEILLDLWYAEPADKRWREMQFDIDGRKFHARNFFPEDLKKRETYEMRRERAVRERFGDKPIYYPPL